MSKKILIVGDSWGCGEWDRLGNQYLVVHKGLEEFLSSTHEVKNLSIPAGSNIMAVDNIAQYYKEYDTIIWIVSEPSRNFQQFNYYYKNPSTNYIIVDLNQDYLEQCKTALCHDIKKVRDLCGMKTIVIGGLHKVQKEYQHGFKTIVNWLDLLGGSALETYYINDSVYHEKYFVGVEHDKNENEKRKKFFNYIFQNKDFFYPDGIHPNKKSHRILYDYIKDHI